MFANDNRSLLRKCSCFPTSPRHVSCLWHAFTNWYRFNLILFGFHVFWQISGFLPLMIQLNYSFGIFRCCGFGSAITFTLWCVKATHHPWLVQLWYIPSACTAIIWWGRDRDRQRDRATAVNSTGQGNRFRLDTWSGYICFFSPSCLSLSVQVEQRPLPSKSNKEER